MAALAAMSAADTISVDGAAWVGGCSDSVRSAPVSPAEPFGQPRDGYPPYLSANRAPVAQWMERTSESQTLHRLWGDCVATHESESALVLM